MSDIRTPTTFMDALLSGEALVQDVDDWIDVWHDGPDHGVELHEFLGMSWEEYRLFVERPESLRFTLAARKTNQPVADILAGVRTAGAAARSDPGGQAEELLAWLLETGRVEQVPRSYP